MKNRYLKGAHLSERKFKEILKLFSEDLTATQIASISGVSRVTVNSYLKKIRQQIARYCEQQQPAESMVKPGNSQERHDHYEHRNGHDTAVSVKTEVSRAIKPIVFGIYRHSERLHTEILPDVSRAMIHAIVRGRSVLETLGTAERLRHFSNVVDLGHYRLYRLEHNSIGENNNGTAAEDIDAFWGLTKHRLAKFKGLNRSTVYLHLKECEFRYNHRNEDLYEVLLNLLKTHTLNLS